MTREPERFDQFNIEQGFCRRPPTRAVVSATITVCIVLIFFEKKSVIVPISKIIPAKIPAITQYTLAVYTRTKISIILEIKTMLICH